MEMRDQMQKVALESPAYGYRRITAELQRRGFEVNHKRVLRMMREDNLLCVRRRAFVVTTDSRHNLPVYPNLARHNDACGDQSALGRRHHLHPLADGVRLPGGGAGRLLAARDRLGAGPDAGSGVGRGGASHGPVASGKPAPGLVHHSDRGVQYASLDYTGMLKQHQAIISMSRKGNPYDNAACESFMKTLKYEEVYRNEYRDFHEARASIGEFLERVYNQKRLHSALGYLPPAEFENGAVQ